MKKYIGYGILGVFLAPFAAVGVLIVWPMPFMIWLMGWLFDYDRDMEPAGYVCGILAVIAWLGLLCSLALSAS